MKEQNKILDEAINALKNEPTPTSPPQQTVNTTLAKLVKATGEPHTVTINNLIKVTERIKAMKSLTKLTTAAAIIIAIVLSITFLGKSVTPAYAIEQTIEANRAMRHLHLKYFDSSHDDVAKECWLEFDEDGKVKNVRINWSEWMGGELVVWNPDKTEIWSRKQSRLTTFNDEIYTARILKMARRENPKLAVERLYERQVNGEVKIEIGEPSNKSEPIIVTATGSGKSTKRFVLSVDQATKLVTAIEWYQLKDGEYKYQGVMEYHDYNVPINAKMFTLDDEVPADVKRIDTRTQHVGLAQGDLTDKEIALKVVREFFEALITKDYTKAGQICGGLTATEIQKGWGKLKIVRIVSISEPAQPSKLSKVFPKMQRVPYTIEVEKDGKKITQRRWHNVRRVFGRRDQWVIH